MLPASLLQFFGFVFLVGILFGGISKLDVEVVVKATQLRPFYLYCTYSFNYLSTLLVVLISAARNVSRGGILSFCAFYKGV